MRRPRGMTLLELIISLAIIAILSTLAVPGLGNLRYDSERAAAVNGFLHSLLLARSEAIKTGAVVSLCKSTDGNNCSHRLPEWTTGWIVFVNADRDEPPQHDPGERIIAVNPGWARGRITSNRDSFSFRPYVQGVVNGTVTFCDARGAAHARALIINHAARPRVSKRDASHRALRC